jgi:hypothetical protein
MTWIKRLAGLSHKDKLTRLTIFRKLYEHVLNRRTEVNSSNRRERFGELREAICPAARRGNARRTKARGVPELEKVVSCRRSDNRDLRGKAHLFRRFRQDFLKSSRYNLILTWLQHPNPHNDYVAASR